jgi:ankyrin repeat protein
MKQLSKFIIFFMISLSFNSFALNDDEEMEFTGAVNDGNIKIVKRYVETMSINLEDSYFAWTPLLMAAAKNQMEVLEYLIGKGADISYTHPITRWNALHHAVFNNNKKMVKFLADAGINIQQKIKGDVSIVKAIRDEGREDMAKYLLSIGIKNDGCKSRCF